MAPAPRIGTEFAGYRIEGLLGRGGMGVLYRAEHPRLGATIALKVMEPGLAQDEVFRERFVREARAAAQIKHPNIVPIYDAGEWHGDLYIAMRYIEGDDLRSVLRKGGALSPQETYEIGLQIAGALDASHRSGLIHRDVKPGNILIEPAPDANSALIAYLADLGLTKHVDSQSGVTASGELLGTIDYIAPEQIDGSRVDGRADIYSLACVLFECLTGTLPYIRENQAAILWAHLHDEVPRATTVNPALTPAVDAALARGMAKSPDDRFSTARELVAALQAPLEASATVSQDGALTRSMPSAPPTSSPARRRRGKGAVVLAALAGLLLGGATAVGVAVLVLDDETPAPAAAERQNTSEDPPASETTTTGETTDGGTTQSPRLAAMTPFDKELLPNVPDELQTSCRHVQPLTDDFYATLSCRPGEPVSSLTYSKAKSGFLLFDHFLSSVAAAGLSDAQPLGVAGLCSSGVIPSVNSTVPQGLSGRSEMPAELTRDERLGYLLCDEHASRYRMEWMTSEIGVHAVATGKELEPLFEWWSKDAGPEP